MTKAMKERKRRRRSGEEEEMKILAMSMKMSDNVIGNGVMKAINIEVIIIFIND